MTYSPTDPSTWSLSIAGGFIIGVDIGLAQDHATMVVGGPWPADRQRDRRRAHTSSSTRDGHAELADAIAAAAHEFRAKPRCRYFQQLCVYLTASYAVRRDAPNRIAPVVITNAHSHATAPSPMPVTVGALRTALPRWTLSKRELIETDRDGAGQPVAKDCPCR